MYLSIFLYSSPVSTQSMLNFKGMLKLGFFEIVCGDNCLVMLSASKQLVSASAPWQMDSQRLNNSRSCKEEPWGVGTCPGRHWGAGGREKPQVGHPDLARPHGTGKGVCSGVGAIQTTLTSPNQRDLQSFIYL